MPLNLARYTGLKKISVLSTLRRIVRLRPNERNIPEEYVKSPSVITQFLRSTKCGLTE